MRILPTYAAGYLITCGVIWAVSDPNRELSLGSVLAGSVPGLQFVIGTTAPGDGIVWTLIIELVFYAICLITYRTLTRRWQVIAAVALACAATQWLLDPSPLGSPQAGLRYVLLLACPFVPVMLVGVVLSAHRRGNLSQLSAVLLVPPGGDPPDFGLDHQNRAHHPRVPADVCRHHRSPPSGQSEMGGLVTLSLTSSPTSVSALRRPPGSRLRPALRHDGAWSTRPCRGSHSGRRRHQRGLVAAQVRRSPNPPHGATLGQEHRPLAGDRSNPFPDLSSACAGARTMPRANAHYGAPFVQIVQD